ncbi:MAG: single-stranded-DNA-specific exonuclease RecJ [bacterium]
MKQWKLAAIDDGPAQKLARRAFIPLPLACALMARGVSDDAEIDRFLNPRLSDIGDPFTLPDMAPAVERIWKAIRSDEAIVVYGDYDVDGVTSAALMSLVLSRLGARVFRYLPNRMEEGYGLGVETVERCISTFTPGLIVTTDCGSASHEAVKAARAAGVDVVVTDHHEVPGEAAPAVAVVNPKLGLDPQTRCLAGVGVAFKVCHALLKHGRDRKQKTALDLDLRGVLDLVALGTVSDMVPMIHENRILVRHGLAQLNRRERLGLRVLSEIAGATGELGTYHVGFVLGPRMNAAGRLGKADDALELIMTDNPTKARELASVLDLANKDRKQIEGEIMDDAFRRIDAFFDPEIHFGIVVGAVGWHVGVIGIVASRLVHRYGRPAIVVGFDDAGIGRGSCRSIEGFDLLGGLKACSEYLTRYGGHEMAAGLEIKTEAFDRFQKAFQDACATGLKGRDLRTTLELESWVSLAEVLDPAFMDGVTRMAPFGVGNTEPVWGLKNIQIIGSPRILKDAHLKLRVGVGADVCDAIGFKMADRLAETESGRLDLAFNLRANTYMNRTSPQLNLIDFRKSAN